MRPTVFMLSAAALAAAAAASPSAAQDRVEPGPERVRVHRSDDGTRAVLGVTLAPARGRGDTLGVRIADVAEEGPAAKAGIEEGDRIVAIDGTALRIDPADADDPVFGDLASRRLQRTLAKHEPGDEVTLTVQRGRESRTVKVRTVAASTLATTLASARGFGLGRDEALVRGFASARAFGDSARARAERRAALGVSVGATGSRRDTLGLFVSAVAADGPAEKAGIVEGARIASIGTVDLRVSRDDADDPEIAALRSRRFTRELDKHQPGDDVSLRVWQNGAYRTVTVKAGRSSEVYKGRGGFAYSFGDGDGAFVMPPMPPMAPMSPMMPMMPMAMYRLAPSAATTIAPRRFVRPRVRRTVEM